MNETKRKYKRSCKTKTITFYKHEEDLLKFANSINFQKFVKEALRKQKFIVENDLKL